jgi:hypothetical protein
MYYLWLDQAQAGPFTLAQLAEKWQAKRITPLTLYWEEGNADWLPLHNIAGLLETLPASSPPTVPALPSVPPSAPPDSRETEEVVWSGHPSLWGRAGSIFWGVLLTPVLIGILILVQVFWSRASTRYRVTTRRVSLETGIFTRTSRELRIEDIRSIAARANIFGIGDIEFSTAARAEAEVIFWGLSRVERVRDLVKQLQNNVR